MYYYAYIALQASVKSLEANLLESQETAEAAASRAAVQVSLLLFNLEPSKANLLESQEAAEVAARRAAVQVS